VKSPHGSGVHLLRENSGIRFTLHKVFFLRIYYKRSRARR